MFDHPGLAVAASPERHGNISALVAGEEPLHRLPRVRSHGVGVGIHDCLHSSVMPSLESVLSSFEHEKIREAIKRGERPPHDQGDFEVWWSGLSHVRMLQRNAHEQGELIVAALSPSVFVHAAVVNTDHPGLDDHDGLLRWSGGLFSQKALTRSWVITRDEIVFEPHGA